MLIPMTKVHVIGHRRRLDATLEVLQQLRIIHVIDVTQDSTARLPPLTVDDARRHELDEVRYLRARLDGLLGLLDAVPTPDPELHPDLDEVRRQVEASEPEIERLTRQLDDLEAEKDTLPRHVESLRRLLPLVPELTELDTYDTMAVIIDARHSEVLGDLNVTLAELLGGNFEIISDVVDTATIGAIVVFPRRARADVEAVFGRRQVARLRLPHQYEAIPFRDAIASMELRLELIDGEVADTRLRIADLVRAHPDWVAARDLLVARQDQLGIIRKLGATAHTFVVSGWVPDRRLPELREALYDRAGGDVLVEMAALDVDERPPVELENVARSRPFQPLVRLLSLPRYGTLDPTSLMSLFLPLFFGMMLGDIAYGLIIGVVAVAVVRRMRDRSPVVADFGRIFIQSAVWTVIWGVIYGELLGDLGRRWWGLEPLWIDREESLQPLLLFALAVGGAHILLGLVLGLWQAQHAHDRHTMLQRLGHLTALVGLFLVAGVVAGLLPNGFMTPAVAAVVVGLVVLSVLAGPMGILLGPLEFMGTIGNVLSYLRLAAIGLASVYLARVANELGRAGPLWLGIIVAVLFHALNLALGVFSPTIQALRLHYVEFFQKFYTEGGDPYEPFGRSVSLPTPRRQGSLTGKE